MSIIGAKRFIRIIQAYLTSDYNKKILRLETIKQNIENWIFELKIEDACKDLGYERELKYIRKKGLAFFPYKQLKSSPIFESGIDPKTNLPYVVHNGKRLFFPKSYRLDFCKMMYKSYIDGECLLGGGYREKCPHQYQTDTFRIEDGDILVDVGCAEALLSLDTIDIVSKVYLLETDKEWIRALEETFKDYKNKVTIINKYVSGEDSDSTVTLKTVLKDEIDKPLFIKMDIEGAEINVLKGSKDFLKSAKNVKIACCTYHNQNDSRLIENLYKDMGFNYEFSDGYMLFLSDPNQFPPYFRRGIIRGWK